MSIHIAMRQPFPVQLGAAMRPGARMGRLSHVAAWVVPVAAVLIDAFRRGVLVGGDAPIFMTAGRTLLSAHWSHAFADSTVQAGPLQLALFGALGRSHEALALGATDAPLALALAIATVLLVVAATRAAGVANPVFYGGAGVLAVLTGLTYTVYRSGHPADGMLPLLWILAAAAARRGHARWAGLLIGLSAGIETWAILGVAVLVLAPRRREAAIGALLAAVTAVALFLPFLLGGHFAMLSFAWSVRPPSPLSLLLPLRAPFGWPLRLAQGLLAVSAGAAVARTLRDSPHVLWIAPLAIVVTRLLVDPLFFSYYLAAPNGLVCVGAAAAAAHLRATRIRGADLPAPASRAA